MAGFCIRFYGGWRGNKWNREAMSVHTSFICGYLGIWWMLRFLLILSETLLVELQEAPDQVQQVLANLHEDHHELIEKTGKIIALRDAYVSTGVVGTSSLLDAEHIASATVAKADLIVSWNFKHIVHYEKIRGYNAVNQMNQYPGLDIRTPREVVE